MEFYTSDSHFNHLNIISYCNRPFSSVEEMNEAIISNWNSRVTNNDIVYHLGDFCMGQRALTRQLASRLNGHIILVIGNHDSKKYCQEVFEIKKYLFKDNFLMVHDPKYTEIYLSEQPNIKLVLHGHVHTEYKERTVDNIRYINVGVDVRNFMPQTIEELLI